MQRLALLLTPVLFSLSVPALAADLDYPDRQAYAPPPVAERKIVEHHHYYHQEPTVYEKRVVEPRVIVEPRVVEEPIYRARVYPRRFAFAYRDYKPHYFFPRHRYWAHRAHSRWW